MDDKQMVPSEPTNPAPAPIIKLPLATPAVTPPVTAIPAETPAFVLEWLQANKRLWAIVISVALVVLGILCGVLFMLKAQGLASNDYSYVANLYSQSSNIGRLMAAVTGAMLAFMVVRPLRLRKKNKEHSLTLWIIFIILGLIAGVIPGIVLLIIFLLGKYTKPKLQEPTFKQPALARIPKPSNWWALLAFIFGLIPGFILFTIISYPLGNHACRLSGSKYC